MNAIVVFIGVNYRMLNGTPQSETGVLCTFSQCKLCWTLVKVFEQLFGMMRTSKDHLKNIHRTKEDDLFSEIAFIKAAISQILCSQLNFTPPD